MGDFLVEWAESAPVRDTYERIILMKLARHASTDGTGAFPAVSTLGECALCDHETVRRRLRALEKRGLIGRGDQSLVAKRRADRRPVVYDVLVPRSWYSDSMWEKAQKERTNSGLPPLDPASRPDIKTPEQQGRATRADKGKPNPKRGKQTTPPPEGSSTTPLTEANDPSNSRGTTPLTEANDPSRGGGNPFFNPPTEPTQEPEETPGGADGALFGEPERQETPQQQPSDADRFGEFWAVYPRQRDPKAAETNWTKALRKSGVTADVLIEAAARYAREVEAKGTETEFVKVAKNWLREECWRNEPEPQRSPTSQQRAGRPQPYRNPPAEAYAKPGPFSVAS